MCSSKLSAHRSLARIRHFDHQWVPSVHRQSGTPRFDRADPQWSQGRGRSHPSLTGFSHIPLTEMESVSLSWGQSWRLTAEFELRLLHWKLTLSFTPYGKYHVKEKVYIGCRMVSTDWADNDVEKSCPWHKIEMGAPQAPRRAGKW